MTRDCNDLVAQRDDRADPGGVSAPVTGRLLVVATAIVVCLAPSSSASADRIVRVRGGARIELISSPSSPETVRGTLRDDNGVPLTGRALDLSIRPTIGGSAETMSVVTDARGRFEGTPTRARCPCVVDASFAGDLDLEGASVRITMDGQHAHVALRVSLPEGNRLSLDTPEHALDVIATGEAGGAGLEIVVRNEAGVALAEGRTDPRGRLTLTLRSDDLGPAAAGRLVVRSEADATRAVGQTEVPIVRYRAVHLEWTDSSETLREGTSLGGRLVTSVGPLAHRPVGVYVDGEHALTLVTDGAGAFAFPLHPSVARGAAEIVVEARFVAEGPWLDDARSPERRFVVTPSVPILPWLALSSALAFGGVALWLSRRRTGRAASDAPRESTPGVSTSRASSILAQTREVSGTLVRAATGDAIAGARVRCGDVETRSGPDGRFALLPPTGSLRFEASAPGFEPIARPLMIPNRGEWIDVVVRLESRRDLARRALLDVLSRFARDEVPATATDREIAAIVRAAGADPGAIDALAAEVEVLVYAERPPSEEALASVRAKLTALTPRTTRVDSKLA